MQLGHKVVELESQLGAMEHRCHSLKQEKEQLEEQVRHKQAQLDQAAAAACQAKNQAFQDAEATLERLGIKRLAAGTPVAVITGRLPLLPISCLPVPDQVQQCSFPATL